METMLDKLTKEMKGKALKLTRDEARFVVDNYYVIQDYRTATSHQLHAVERKVDDQPIEFLKWICLSMQSMEGQLRRALKTYAATKIEGKWAMSITGIGPVIASGLLAHIDINLCPTVGHIWNFAGLNPDVRWLGSAAAAIMTKAGFNPEGKNSTKALDVKDAEKLITHLASLIGIPPERLLKQALQYDQNKEGTKEAKKLKLTAKNIYRAASRRPWNAQLKTLCWKIGESFNKTKNKESDIYGKILQARRDKEDKMNNAGAFKEIALAKAKKVGKTTDAYASYSIGKLPLGHLHARSKRYAVKIFLSHYHHAAYLANKGEAPPKPFAIEHLGHAHMIEVPNLGIIGKV